MAEIDGDRVAEVIARAYRSTGRVREVVEEDSGWITNNEEDLETIDDECEITIKITR